MSDFGDLKAQVAEWANRQDWSDLLVTSFVRMAEEYFNQALRIDRMIQFDEGKIRARCAALPDDWLAMDLVKVANECGADGYLPARYKARDEFFNSRDLRTELYYTLEGRTMYFGGVPKPDDGVVYQLSYYGEVPVFTDDAPSWLYTKYPGLYLSACLMHAAMHAVGEEQSAANFKSYVDAKIQALNAGHLGAKASGSRVTRPRMRTFG